MKNEKKTIHKFYRNIFMKTFVFLNKQKIDYILHKKYVKIFQKSMNFLNILRKEIFDR